MASSIVDAALEKNLSAWRRDLHKHPEVGWTEIYTTSFIASKLNALGIDFTIGSDLFRADQRFGLPDEESGREAYQRALDWGADPAYAECVRDGFTGIVATFGSGKPDIGLRFDIDALPILESAEADHIPAAEGFRSVHDGVMHACGHDFHAAIGIGMCQLLSAGESALKGTVHVIFQPAEEGVRGARAMVASGLANPLDFVISQHNRTNWSVGEIRCGILGYQATTKFDVVIHGNASHAGGNPQEGSNAIMAAAAAVQALYSIPRHSGGTTRINVGTLHAGSGRNIIADRAEMAIETRGATSEVERYMYDAAVNAIEHAAAMHRCSASTHIVGSAPSAESTPLLTELAENVASEIYGWTVHPPTAQLGSEDFTYFMNHVQIRGGMATHLSLGAALPHVSLNAHTDTFDADERYMPGAVSYLISLVKRIGERYDSDELRR